MATIPDISINNYRHFFNDLLPYTDMLSYCGKVNIETTHCVCKKLYKLYRQLHCLPWLRPAAE
jgi:hypothetical protein